MKTAFILLILCLLCSCSKEINIPNATNLTNKDASFIEYMASTHISSVDGVSISNFSTLGQPQDVLKISSGQHVLMIRYSDERGKTRGDVRLDVSLEPSKRYWLAPTSTNRTMKEGDRVGFTITPMYSGAPSSINSTSTASDSPVGTWKTIDDETGKLVSMMQITEKNRELQAEMLQVLQSDEGTHPICIKCDGLRKNQPVEGMTIMWGVRQNHDTWDGGSIIDIGNGKIYKVKLQTIENGTKLIVHGYTGFSLNGRSQVWLREE